MPVRERSPNYPTHNLEAALGFARSIYAKERMNATAPEILARALGHEGLTGPSRSKLASLRQFGLLLPQGENLALTDMAFTILHSPDERERALAVAKSAMTPPLFGELFKEKPDASNESLTFFLRQKKKFSDDGAARAVKAFRETTAFAKLAEIGYTPPEDPAPAATEPVVPAVTKPAKHDDPPKPPLRVLEQNAVAYTWPLPNGTDVQIIFAARPDVESIEAVIDYLNVVKPKVAPKNGVEASVKSAPGPSPESRELT
jgi:hypothetical protein